MDITTLIGLLGGFGSMFAAIIIEKAPLGKFFTNWGAWVIILGGTFCATMLSSRKEDVARIPKIFTELLKDVKHNHFETIETITKLADKARREGLISLERDREEITNPMLAKGIQLVIDGTDGEIVEAILQTNMLQLKNKATGDATIFETLGGFSPTMGIVGTVMGLVGALAKMNSAGTDATIEALAVAFIATFWGIALANLLFLPICGKIRARWREELVSCQIILEGVLSIQAGSNPRIVRDRLLCFLPIEEVQAYEAAGGGGAEMAA